MRLLRQFVWRFRRHRKEAELTEELRFHLETEAEALEESGLTSEVARARARRDLGNIGVVREDTRAAWGRGLAERLAGDIAYSIRRLAASPGYTAVAVVMLTLGIGVNVALFTVSYQVLIRPLPFERPEELVALWGDASNRGVPESEVAFADFEEWRAARTFEDMALYAYGTTRTFLGAEGAERARVQEVAPNLFVLLGVGPRFGRVFTDAEDGPAALVSEAFWEGRMGGGEELSNRVLEIGDALYTVVGVMPRGFQFREAGTEVWLPLAVDDGQREARGSGEFLAVGRLGSGVSIAEAGAELEAIAQGQAEGHPETNAGRGVRVVSLHEEFAGSSRGLYAALMAAAAAVLLVVSLNVAHLVLLRGARRRDELAVRRSLGATRVRLVAQLAMETVLLAGAGVLGGLVLAQWTVDLLGAFIPRSMTGLVDLTPGAPVFLFAAGVAVLTACVAGLVPAIRLSAPAPIARDGGLRRLLVGGQVAVATALLVCAALFVGTLASLDRVDPGFEPENLLAVEIGGFAAYRDELLSRVRDLPGVESAALTTVRPLTAYPGRRTLSVEGYPSSDPDLEPRALFRTVGPHYLETLGVPLVGGRMFDETDRMGSEPVALVNESMSARYWAGGDPVGRRVKLGAADSDNSWYTVVGVIGDVRQRSLETEAEPELMLPYLQENGPYGPRDMLVRVSERTPDPAASIGGVLRALDPAVPVDIRTMAEVAGSGLGERRARTILISGFAALTLALSMLGVYALVAFAVADRSREMGIRLAVGARSQTLIRMMLRESLGPALAGSVAGLAAAMGVGRMVEGFLWGVRPTEPLALLLAALVVLGSAAAAAYLPARRLARIEPARVLHYE